MSLSSPDAAVPYNDDRQRLSGTMAITGQKGDYDASFELSPEYGQIWYYTDSGGPVLQNNKLIGVLSGLGGCTGSGNKETNPLGCKGYAAFIDPAFITTHVDQDGDGVGDTLDNCPSDPNADQKDCDAVDDGSSPQGDACDPDPCPYPEDATQIFSRSVHGNVAVFHNSNVRVDYRPWATRPAPRPRSIARSCRHRPGPRRRPPPTRPSSVNSRPKPGSRMRSWTASRHRRAHSCAGRSSPRVFRIDVETCPHCGGRRVQIAFLTDPGPVKTILDHLDLPAKPPPIAPARAPPQRDLDVEPELELEQL